jgi:hypothetical protein
MTLLALFKKRKSCQKGGFFVGLGICEMKEQGVSTVANNQREVQLERKGKMFLGTFFFPSCHKYG